MKKLSTKVLAIILAVMMVATSAPFSAIAATTAPNSVLTALSDAITAYRTKMNGTIYTNMPAAYSSYIAAVKTYDKAKYGANDVTQSDIESATSDLTSKTNAMAEWVHPTGTARPNASTKGFSDDSNTNTTVNSNASGYATGWRPFADATGNTYVSDVYSSTYQNLTYVQTGVSSAKYSWGIQNCQIALYVPEAVVLYDGSTGFEARIGVMAQYYAGTSNNKKRKVGQITINGNDYFSFGDNWLQNAKSDGDTNFGVTSRYEKLDLVGAIGRPSPTDRASGNATVDTTGTRLSSGGWLSNGDKYYIGNYLSFHVPSNVSYTNASYSYTSVPIKSQSGENPNSDTWTGNATIKVDVLNYSLLLNKLNSSALKNKLSITDANPYLEGGLSTLLTRINEACSWTPSGSNVSTLASTMNTYITNIDNALNGVTADDSPYGSLATKMGAVLATPESGATTVGDWYNVNNDTLEYTDESLAAFVKAFTYAQAVFDQNTTFADSYSFSAQSVTVGTDIPETTDVTESVTVSVPAATKTVTEVYNDLMAAQLVVSQRVNATTLTMYIEELTVALEYADVFGFKDSNTETNMRSAINTAKDRVWGKTTVEWDDPNTGEHHSVTVSNYGNPAKLLKDTTANQRTVANQEAALLPYIQALTVNTSTTVAYNDFGDQNSLGRILQDMADTNLYPRGDYINADTLDEGVTYVNNNFIPQVIPNQNTPVVAGIVAAKVQEYKDFIQYCQDVIDALEKTFLALDNGTIINTGTQEDLTPSAIEDKWALTFTRYNNVVVFRTTKANSNLNLGSASLSFWQGDTAAWGAGNEYAAVLDSININDTVGGSNSIHKENAFSTSELPSVALSEEECATYHGQLSMATSNGATYGVGNFRGVRGKSDGSGGYIFGKNGEDGSLTSGLAVTEGTQSAATGVYAYDNTTTLVAGNAYLLLAEEPAVTLTRTTTPKSTTYTNSGYFGSVFYWIADGAGVSALKNVYNGYYHERTTNTYTQTSTVIDISNLKDLVSLMNTLNKGDYTETSWNNMKTKLAAATSNDFGSGKSYREVATSALTSQLVTRYQNLYDAWKSLVPAATNIELTRPVAQAQNEGKDIGAVTRANDNIWYTKYNTNNDVTSQNTYGTYTTNTWNAFKNAYEAGDVAIYGDGSSTGIYATPTFDVDGNTLVVGTRAYARFINNDGDPLDIGDLDALGLTINDIEAAAAMSGVSLSTQQADINQRAANIKSTYAALKRWANFAPVDSAMTALSNTFSSNYDKKYTTASLTAINSAFAASPISTNKFYQIANNAASQHALVNGVAKYDEDDDAAIATEAAAITAALPPTESNITQDNYTAEAVMALVQAELDDPDAKDASGALPAAQALEASLYTTVNIAPLSNKAVIGVNYVEDSELDQAIRTVLSNVVDVTYNVRVFDQNGTLIHTYAAQPYGTKLTINSSSGEAIKWTYNYTSKTVTNHKPTSTGVRETFEYVVIGDTDIYEGPSGSGAGYKVMFDDSLNHLYAVEYVPANTTLTYSGNSVVINIPGQEAITVTAPTYPFYKFDNFSIQNYDPLASASYTVTGDTTVVANYSASVTAATYMLTVYNISRGNLSDFEVNYNSKITIDPTLIVETGRVNNPTPGHIYIDGEEEALAKKAGVTPNGSLYCMTYLEDANFDDWSTLRGRYDESVYNSEIPFGANNAGEFTHFIGGDTIIVLYENDSDYQAAIDDHFVNESAKAMVKDNLILTNSKFTMHGTFYVPNKNDIVECGVLMYLGNEENIDEALTIKGYSGLGAYRLKYTKSREYNNINVSMNRGEGTYFYNGSFRIRYRTYVTYKVGNSTTTVYSDIADDTEQF